MVHVGKVPEGLQELMNCYGVPGKVVEGKVEVDRVWETNNVHMFQTPFPLRLSWNSKEIVSFQAHRLVGEAIADALREIREIYGYSFLKQHNLDMWGGCYNPRLKRGGTEMSTHSWAVAVDYCPDLGAMGKPAILPWLIVEAFRKRGFENFPKFDGAHFQSVRGY